MGYLNNNGQAEAPSHVLIVGAGVFGLSTALAILDKTRYNGSQITIIDSATTLPNPVGSSVDASRIVRADYAQYEYAKLACLAQEHWRDQESTGWGGEGRYHETGFVLTGDAGTMDYIRTGREVVESIAKAGFPLQLGKIAGLKDQEEIRSVTALPGVSGDEGYVNWNSGWADAGASVSYAIDKIKAHPTSGNRVSIKPGTQVSRLNFAESGQCKGVMLSNGTTIDADLTILASGAWTPSLIDLHNRCLATGQVLAYLKLSQEEQDYLEQRPVIINFSRGTFIIPPQQCEFKIARHGYGYRNPKSPSPSEPTNESQISIPRTDTNIPAEADTHLREALAELFPPDADPSSLPQEFPRSLLDISKRPFTKTRICWYTDTPTGNFLIDYAPLSDSSNSPIQNDSLFIATGGSGHGFKFFPILGSYIVDAIERKLDKEYYDIWRWPTDAEIEKQHGFCEAKEFSQCLDGSRSGRPGMFLEDELRRGVAQVGGV